MQLSEYLTNPHFNRLVLLIRIPFHSRIWQERHPEIPFSTLYWALDREAKADFSIQRTSILLKFRELIQAVATAQPWLAPTQETWQWFSEEMEKPDAATIFSLLQLAVVLAERYVTPAEIAAYTHTEETMWRQRAREGQIPGTMKHGRQLFLPLSFLRAQGMVVPPDAGRQVMEDPTTVHVPGGEGFDLPLN